ncbi:GNAT family N-acetyltransferase [Paenibacillus sabinae]|uniref:GCN5-like N-acetyltransferase n=1 Tax=Paenibacillus sabinae T27 TaxID=1268072 RepID=X4ZHP2_9BACL|nr:GNAT family protein [Paenibacillus sabinae]AHV96235.1 GCN5-like N-acetyltransferase [Paenibacillus sabinae T27]
MSGSVRLAEYEDKFKESLLAFFLPKEQEEFTGMPADTLEPALRDVNRHPTVILDGDTAVGFFVLHGWDGIADVYRGGSRAMLFRAFLIDYASQGKGYATAALRLLPSFVSTVYPGTDEVVLSVNEENSSALRLYMTAGFQDNGLRRMGPKGPQKILQYPLVGADNVVHARRSHGEE